MDHTSKSASSRTELQMARSMCWHCQSEVAGEYFCERCIKVQPLSKEQDYFTCLGLPRLLTIDTTALENKFYEMSRSFHPDFYQTKTDTERTISLGNSALLNAAYRTLKDPIQRAEYLVRLEAGSVKEIRNQPPADLFEEILSLQEDLEEFRAASGQPSADLATLQTKLQSDRETLEQRQRDMETRLLDLFETWDRLQRQSEPTEPLRAKKESVLKEMRELLSNRTYVRNIVNDLVATVG
ncbi:MAG: Fe-S protein assembly co-chaperone HscB [Nitrospira sp.]